MSKDPNQPNVFTIVPRILGRKVEAVARQMCNHAWSCYHKNGVGPITVMDQEPYVNDYWIDYCGMARRELGLTWDDKVIYDYEVEVDSNLSKQRMA